MAQMNHKGHKLIRGQVEAFAPLSFDGLISHGGTEITEGLTPREFDHWYVFLYLTHRRMATKRTE